MKGFGIPRILDAGRGSPTSEIHRECTETRGLRMQFSQVQSSLGCTETASRVEREVPLKFLNHKAENFMQSLNFWGAHCVQYNVRAVFLWVTELCREPAGNKLVV